MTHYDAFNGDADGICALHQLRLAEPRESVLITGVKRDINLVKQIPTSDASSATVLDVSLDKNRDALQGLLDASIPVSYYDHHFAGDIPASEFLDAHIDTDANTCTGLIVNKQLKSAFLPWAVTAAFGDNLLDSARTAAAELNLNEQQLAQLQSLGTLLNYNGYGSTLDDLFFPPAELYERVKPYADPFAFIAEDDAYKTLDEGYRSDMQQAMDTKPYMADDHTAVFIFPEEKFARRVSGVYANDLAQQNPDRAHAMLSTLPGDGYLVSVRAPLANKTGADELCRQFDTGGGRKAAAGINFLPASDLDKFSDAFKRQFTA
jgi:hypothetical protein